MLKYMRLKVESPAVATAGLFWLLDRIAPEPETFPAFPPDRLIVDKSAVDSMQIVRGVLAAGPGAVGAPGRFYSWHEQLSSGHLQSLW